MDHTPGTLLVLGRAASPQFVQPIRLRLVRAAPAVTCDGWVWVDGYQLDQAGRAVERRTVFVRIAGVRLVRG